MQEEFIYSVMTSVLGITIVFTLLVFLSLLMVLIKKFADGDTAKGAAPKAAKASSAKKSGSRTGKGLPLPVIVAAATATMADNAKWLSAAVSAFLAAEEDEQNAPKASGWSSAGAAKYDPWVANNKITRKAPGV